MEILSVPRLVVFGCSYPFIQDIGPGLSLYTVGTQGKIGPHSMILAGNKSAVTTTIGWISYHDPVKLPLFLFQWLMEIIRERERGNIVEIWLDHENKEKAITENMEILQNKVNNSFSNRHLFSISHTLQKFTKFCFQGLKSRENHNSQEENNTKYHHIETIRENDFLLRSIITRLIVKNLVSDNILKAIIKVRDLNLLFARVYCLRISTMSTLGCHLNQHIELLDRHLWGEVEQK